MRGSCSVELGCLCLPRMGHGVKEMLAGSPARRERGTSEATTAMVGPLPQTLLTLLLLLSCHTLVCVAGAAAGSAAAVGGDADQLRRVKLFDSVYMNIPDQTNNPRSIVSFEVDTGRDNGGSGRGKKKKLLEKFLPMFVMPFILQSTLIPIFLGMIKFFLFKSLTIGKLALVLIILNAFKNHNSFKG